MANRTLEEILSDFQARIGRLERRRKGGGGVVSGGGGGSVPTVLAEGYGVTITGAGTGLTPYVIGVDAATDILPGISEVATQAEVTAGADNSRFVTPATLKSALATLPGGSSWAIIDAKGDLIVGSADDTAARLAVGPDGHVLTADAAEPLGVKWSASQGGGDSGPAPAGVIAPYGGAQNAVPTGWLACDGAAYSRSLYSALYAVIGTTYGAGDGSTTFNVPNLLGRVPVGQYDPDGIFTPLGSSGGEVSHLLTAAESGVQEHRHAINGMDNATAGNTDDGYARGSGPGREANFRTGTVAADQGGNSFGSPMGALNAQQAHNNIQPYTVVNYIISTGQGAPTVPDVLPVALWGELGMINVGGVKPLNGGIIVWDRVTPGTLGLVVSADQKTVTFTMPGSYRVAQHIGISTLPGGAANMNAVVDGVTYRPSLTYGTAGPAGAFNVEGEFFVDAVAGSTMSFAANAPGGIYDWSFVRIEKTEPFWPTTQTQAVHQGPTALRDSIYGVPADDPARVSLANRSVVWFNTDRNWFETYYAASGKPGMTVPGVAATLSSGWYPNAGTDIHVSYKRVAQQGGVNGNGLNIMWDQVRTCKGFPGTTPLDVVTVPVAGYYEISTAAMVAQASGGFFDFWLYNSEGLLYRTTGAVLPHVGSHSQATLPSVIEYCGVGSQIRAMCSSSSDGAVEANTGYLTIRYVGPPVLNQ